MQSKRSPALLLLAALLASTLIAIAWFAFSEDFAAATAGPGASERADSREEPARRGSSDAAAVESDRPRAESARESNAQTKQATREVVGDVASRELESAKWVEGRVVFPLGTPVDEVAYVVADGKDFESFGDHRAKVGGDGSFRVAFSKESRTGKLTLDARFLYLVEPLALRLSKSPDDLVLEPELGGCIAGVVTAPMGASDTEATLAACSVKITNWVQYRHVERDVRLDAQGRYELRALPCAEPWDVEFVSSEWTSIARSSVEVEPGRVTTLDFSPSVGARVVGRVTDSNREPVGNAFVLVFGTGGSLRTWSGFEARAAGVDGRFDQRGILPGARRLSVEARGYLPLERELGELRDGEVRDLGDLALDSGAVVTGVVKWNDGAIASGAYVRAELADPEQFKDFEFERSNLDYTRVGADGLFRIGGLPPGRVHLEAHAKDGLKPGEDEKGEPKERSGLKGATWRAELRDVEPGSHVELVLHPGLAVVGRVVDHLGQPIAKFSLEAIELGERGERQWMPRRVTARIDDEQGRFVLEGLTTGRWRVNATSRGYMTGAGIELNVPDEAREVVLELRRTASLSGVVVDPAGEPVGGARVRIQWRSEPGFFSTDGIDLDGKANSKGEFRLSLAPSGPFTVRASHDSFGSSASLELAPAPGEKLEDVKLVLTRGGEIRGRMHESLLAEGRLWRVRLRGAHSDDSDQVRAESDGSFRFVRLTAGDYRLEASCHGEERSRGSFAGANEFTSSVEVLDGGVTDVVVGAPSGTAVALSGRITISGKPLANALVRASCEGVSYQTKADVDGVYRLALTSAGRYSFAVMSGDGASLTLEHEVPQVAKHELDFALPVGRISGRVLGANDKPVAGALVRAHPVRSTRLAASAHSMNHSETDEQGRFELRGLASGEYELEVSDDRSWNDIDARFARTTLTGVVVPEDGERSGVEVRVQEPGIVVCVVRSADGSPAGGAQVHAMTKVGSSTPFASARADGLGRATVRGLAPGEYVLCAQFTGEAACATTSVKVSASSSGEVELLLRPAGELTISTRSSNGDLVQRSVSVVDERGFDWARVATSWDYDTTRGAWKVHPLPTGRYTVRAAGVTRSVPLSSGRAEHVELQLPSDD